MQCQIVQFSVEWLKICVHTLMKREHAYQPLSGSTFLGYLGRDVHYDLVQGEWFWRQLHV